MKKVIIKTSILITLVLVGCSKKKDGSSSGDAIKQTSFDRLYEGLLEKGHRCRKCHLDTEDAFLKYNIPLNFRDKNTAYKSLTESLSNPHSDRKCKGIRYVVPGKVSESFLAAVTLPTFNKRGFGGKADCFPVKDHTQGLRKLNAEEMALIRNWINEGAKR